MRLQRLKLLHVLWIVLMLSALHSAEGKPRRKGYRRVYEGLLKTTSNQLKKISQCSGKYTCLAPEGATRHSLQCIPLNRRCDGAMDCPRGDDERDCPVKCQPDEIVCSDNVCGKTCDNITQCADGMDEMNCACESGKMKCPSGMCATRCNNIVECKGTEDNSDDEKHCGCPAQSVLCRSGKCGAACNGVIDCNDDVDYGEDELNCACPPSHITCPSGKCAQRCNSVTECDGPMDNEDDERNCACPPGMMRCRSGKCGVPCNMMVDCNGPMDMEEDEDPKRCPCPHGNIRCPSGNCGALCNDANDCDGEGDNNEDENCCACPVGTIHCPSGACGTVCDGVVQCNGIEDRMDDEKRCPCPAGTLKCPSGVCAALCNDNVECNKEGDADNDEKDCFSTECNIRCPLEDYDGCEHLADLQGVVKCICPPDANFHCPSGKCAIMCNDADDCDGPGDSSEDESLDICPCPSFNTRCPSGKCGLLCDDNVECDEAEDIEDDEKQCRNDILFRVTPLSGTPAFTAWQTGVGTTTNKRCRNTRVDGCDIHYRDPIIDNWNSLNAKKLRYSIWDGGVEVVWMIFDALGSDMISWFSKDRLLASSYNDLETTKSSWIFQLQFIHNVVTRHFYVNDDPFAGCDNDVLWVVTIDGTGNCYYDQYFTTYPYIWYSVLPTQASTGNPSDFAFGDVAIVSVEEYM